MHVSALFHLYIVTHFSYLLICFLTVFSLLKVMRTHGVTVGQVKTIYSSFLDDLHCFCSSVDISNLGCLCGSEVLKECQYVQMHLNGSLVYCDSKRFKLQDA